MATDEQPSGPGPLIWVVLLLSAVAGAIWGVGVAIATGVATHVVLVLIGMTIQWRLRKKVTSRSWDVGYFSNRLAQARFGNEGRWAFAKDYAKSPERLLDDIEGTIDWFAAAVASSDSDDRIKSVRPHLVRGSGVAAGSKLLGMRAMQSQGAERERLLLAAGLMLHHIGLPMTRSFLTRPEYEAMLHLDKEKREFDAFLCAIDPLLSSMIRDTLRRAERLELER